jgi:hypothetical protein
MTHSLEIIEDYLKKLNLKIIDDSYKPNKGETSFIDNEGYKYLLRFSNVIKNVKRESGLDKFGKSNFYALENINTFLKKYGNFFLYNIPEKYDGVRQYLTFCDNDGYLFWLPFNTVRCTLISNTHLEMVFPTNIYSLKNINHYLKITESPYSLVDGQVYSRSNDKLFFYCSICNSEIPFSMPWNCIRRGSGCPKCNMIKSWESHSKTCARKCNIVDYSPYLLKEWSDLNKKTPEEYSFGTDSIAFWKCLSGLDHPDYRMKIINRTLKHRGCPACSESAGESKVRHLLNEWNVDFISQHSFPDCINEQKLLFDFYIPIMNCVIEYQGAQHYEAVDFGGKGMDDAIERFEKSKKRDLIKKEYCLDNNIKFVEICYLDFKNIKNILEKELSPLLEEGGKTY